jgi:hypothetical protein
MLSERPIMNPLSLIAAVLAFADPWVAQLGVIVILGLSVGAIIRSKMS